MAAASWTSTASIRGRSGGRSYGSDVARSRRSRYPQHEGPLPGPLPHDSRTIGQLVAEAIRLYGRRFFAILPLGLVIALADEALLDLSLSTRVLILVIFAPIFTLAYAVASSIALEARPARRVWLTAIVLGSISFLPAAALLPWFALAAVLWLAVVTNVVPATLAEELPPRAALPRSWQLARADFVHAVGSLATLAILFAVTRIALGLLLRSQGENTVRVSIFLADLLLSPLLFVGAALLYLDQLARVGTRPSSRKGRNTDADLSAAHEPHR